MDTSSDSDGAHSPGGVYRGHVQVPYAVTGYDDKSPSGHSESSSGSGGIADEPCTKGHHKFSIDRILGRFNGGGGGGGTETAIVDSSSPETLDPGMLSHRNELRGAAGESHYIVLYHLTAGGRIAESPSRRPWERTKRGACPARDTIDHFPPS